MNYKKKIYAQIKPFTQEDSIESVWIPLKKIFHNNDDKLSQFMYMGTKKNQNNIVIYLYKNKDTRRYLNLDMNGNAYSYSAEGYKSIALDEALRFSYS